MRFFQLLIAMIMIPFSGANKKVIMFGIKSNSFAHWGAKPYRPTATHVGLHSQFTSSFSFLANCKNGQKFQSSKVHSCGK